MADNKKGISVDLIDEYVGYNPSAEAMQEAAFNSKMLARGKMHDQQAVSEAEKDAVFDKARGMGKYIRDSWGEEDANRALKHYGENLAKNNPYGNLNGSSFKNTLNFSRLADALNNKQYKNWSSLGTFSTDGSGGIVPSGEVGYSSDKRTPIETEEMRLMRENERLDEEQRRGLIQQQQNVNDYALKLQDKMDDLCRNMAEQIGTTELAVQQAWRNAIINIDLTQPSIQKLQMISQRFLQELVLATKSKAVRYALDQTNRHGSEYGAMLSEVLTGSELNEDNLFLASAYRKMAEDSPNYETYKILTNVAAMQLSEIESAGLRYAASGGYARDSKGLSRGYEAEASGVGRTAGSTAVGNKKDAEKTEAAANKAEKDAKTAQEKATKAAFKYNKNPDSYGKYKKAVDTQEKAEQAARDAAAARVKADEAQGKVDSHDWIKALYRSV